MIRVRTSIAALFAIVALGGPVALAQVSSSQQESLAVPLGSIFEIQAATLPSASVNWVLTQGGDFVESSREHIFRTRFSREGRYVLAAEVDVSGNKIQRIFNLDVHAKRPEDTMTADGPEGIVALNPPLQNNRVDISASHQVLTITPVRTDVSVLAIDFDVTSDSNGDGKPENDEDTQNTLFRSEGNPLRIWFVGGSSKIIRFGALLSDGKTTFANITVGNAGVRQPTTQAQDRNTAPIEQAVGMKVLVLKNDNGEVQYALRTPANLTEPVLLVWDFGDGIQSMLDRPVHTYATSGKYDINVEVRSLRSGTVIATASDSVMINRLQEEREPKVSETPENKESGGSLLGLVFKLLISLIGFAGFGALIMFVIGKIKSKGFSLEKTMEKAEQTMVKTPGAESSSDLPPMEITAEEVPATPPPPAEPAEPVPPPEPPAAPESEPEPQPQPPPAAPAQPTSDTPSWLSAGQEETQPTPPTPEPMPEPEPQPEPAPAQAPTEPPQTETAPNVAHDAMQPSTEELQADTGNAPDWLQAGIEKAEAAGQTPAAPPPAPLQDMPPPVDTPLVEEPSAEASEAPETLDAEEAAKREKKRRKRQRYRENVKKRKQDGPAEEPLGEENPAEPVAYIKAEDIEPLDPEPPQESPAPPEEKPEDQNPA